MEPEPSGWVTDSDRSCLCCSLVGEKGTLDVNGVDSSRIEKARALGLAFGSFFDFGTIQPPNWWMPSDGEKALVLKPCVRFGSGKGSVSIVTVETTISYGA